MMYSLSSVVSVGAYEELLVVDAQSSYDHNISGRIEAVLLSVDGLRTGEFNPHLTPIFHETDLNLTVRFYVSKECGSCSSLGEVSFSYLKSV